MYNKVIGFETSAILNKVVKFETRKFARKSNNLKQKNRVFPKTKGNPRVTPARINKVLLEY